MNWKKYLLRLLLILGQALALPAAAVVPTWQMGPPKAAAPLQLPDLQGRRLDLQALRGKVVLVNFWASYCVPCRQEMPSLSRLRTRLAGRGLEVLAVDVAEDKASVTAFLNRLPVSFPVVLDEEGQVMAAWQAMVLPTTFLVDRQGRVRGRLQGEADWDAPEILERLSALLAE
ncbi:MAG: hypothetical protein RIR00_2098 [Pseudomonadota bacterium]